MIPLSKKTSAEILNKLTEHYETLYGIGNVSLGRAGGDVIVNVKLTRFTELCTNTSTTWVEVARHEIRKLMHFASADLVTEADVIKRDFPKCVAAVNAALDARIHDGCTFGDRETTQIRVGSHVTGFTVNVTGYVYIKTKSWNNNMVECRFNVPLGAIVKSKDTIENKIARSVAKVNEKLVEFEQKVISEF